MNRAEDHKQPGERRTILAPRTGARRLWLAALVAAQLVSLPAMATVVERVVAVVGDEAIWMSDIRSRALPYLLRIQQEVPNAAQRAATISQLYKTLVERLIEEVLLAKAARRASIAIRDEEVDQALERVAQQNNITVDALLTEARAGGLTDAQYREELRRQILDARLINLRLQARVQVREEDLEQAYQKAVMAERKRLGFELSWIVLASPGDSAQAVRLGDQIARRARGGESFGELARGFSSDLATADRGGRLGKLQPGQLPPSIDRVIMTLEVGDVSPPIALDGRVVVLRLESRDASALPSFEEARAQLGERIYGEKMGKARQRWLRQLRQQAHVENRL